MENITFLKAYIISTDKTLVRLVAETYKYEDENAILVDKIDIIDERTKKRNALVLSRAGLTSKEIEENGKSETEWVKILSDYFIKNDCCIVTCNAMIDIKNINRALQNNKMFLIRNTILSIDKLCKEYDVQCLKQYTLKDLKENFDLCMKRKGKLKNISLNKIPASVNFAFYIERNNARNYGVKRYIYCDTVLARIYYSINEKKWHMSKKESTEKGLVLENIDVCDIEKQMFKKYNVNNMKELIEKLQKIYFERCKSVC